MNQFVVYKNLFNDKDVLKCIQFIKTKDEANEFVSTLLLLAEKYNLHDHLFQSLLTYLLANHENVFSLSLERKRNIDQYLKKVVFMDLEKIYSLFHTDFSFIDNSFTHLICHYQQSKPIINKEVYEVLSSLQFDLSRTKSIEEFYNRLVVHYNQYGVGMYGLNKAFRYLDGRIVSIDHIGNESFDDLIGYQSQKDKLKENTEAFLNGKKANNVLLYGDSGTGKSSSIKALLNEYYKDGLRMVEIYKHQFQQLPIIINELQNRNYYFIIFMDDLSFEEFEIEYKYLKAVIEGGLEKKPDNILIYATSNRRHLIKETWNDRNSDDVNRNDAMQEKLSLVSRFGVQIMYIHPGKQQYLEIVDGLAQLYHLDIDKEELHKLALQWEIRHSGFSGRNAKQFIHMMLGKNE